MGTTEIWLNVAVWGMIWLVTALFTGPGTGLISFAIGLLVISFNVTPGIALVLRAAAVFAFMTGVYLTLRSQKKRKKKGPGVVECAGHPRPALGPRTPDTMARMASRLRSRHGRKVDIV
ncbi:MAG: hypothetical protein HY671_02660 [Chloroflexi bacterium]|nr:hypothetical protein [Chloroflexota bacterium]